MFNFNNLVCFLFCFFSPLTGTWRDSQIWNEKLQKHSSWGIKPVVMARAHCACKWDSVWMTGFSFLRWFAYSQQQFLVFLSCRITLLMTKARSELKSFSQRSTPSNLLRSLLRQKSITPTSMRRARCACPWSAQRTGNLPPKLTKVGFCLFWVWVSFYVLSASRIDI